MRQLANLTVMVPDSAGALLLLSLPNCHCWPYAFADDLRESPEPFDLAVPAHSVAAMR